MKTRNGDLMLRYMARMEGVAVRFDEVLHRRMRLAGPDAVVSLLMATLTVKVNFAFRQTDDLCIWLEAQRVLGRV